MDYCIGLSLHQISRKQRGTAWHGAAIDPGCAFGIQHSGVRISRQHRCRRYREQHPTKKITQLRWTHTDSDPDDLLCAILSGTAIPVNRFSYLEDLNAQPTR